jgi:hypothetical protein
VEPVDDRARPVLRRPPGTRDQGQSKKKSSSRAVTTVAYLLLELQAGHPGFAAHTKLKRRARHRRSVATPTGSRGAVSGRRRSMYPSRRCRARPGRTLHRSACCSVRRSRSPPLGSLSCIRHGPSISSATSPTPTQRSKQASRSPKIAPPCSRSPNRPASRAERPHHPRRRLLAQLQVRLWGVKTRSHR